MAFNPALAVRSHFSMGESLLQIDQIVNRAKELKLGAVALVDTMTISGMIDFSTKCKAADIKPIIGVRLRVVDDPSYRKPSRTSEEKAVDQRVWYPKLYALTEDGIKRIMRLLTVANDEGHFYKVPQLSFEDVLAELDADALAFSTGDLLSALRRSDATDMLKKLCTVLRASNVFVECCPINTPLFDRLTYEATKICEELELQPLVTYPTFYAEEDDAESAVVSGAITDHAKLDEPWCKKPWVKDFVMITDSALTSRCVLAGRRLEKRYGRKGLFAAGLHNTGVLADMVDYQWEKMPVSLPRMAVDPYKKLEEECRKGWVARIYKEVLGYKPSNISVYEARLEYELGVLKSMGFEDYFLLVQDLVMWSKNNGIAVGPGRGSVGGSLVAYLLGITDVDPIRFDLLFERFINPERLDLPDADLDFMSTRRADVIEYLTKKYGADHVAGISNYQVLQAASALRDVARVMGVELSEMAFTKLVPKEHGKPMSLEEAADAVAEIAKFRDTRPDIWKHATKLEGTLRSLGRHAAGIVVAGEPIVNRAAIERRKDGSTVNWDKRIVEDMGLVKMDILGLSTLDILAIAVENIRKRHSKRLDLLDIPLDDPATLDEFGKGSTVGVFQFESPGMQKLLKGLAKSGRLTFNDICVATALYRPGPLDAGLVDAYINRRAGDEPVTYDHPAVKSALEKTYGVIAFQEQLMQVSRDLCGFSMTEADHLRRAVGKKDKKKMVEMKDKFIEGATAGFVEVEFEDGTKRNFHRKEKLRVKESDDRLTIEEVIENSFTLCDSA